MAATILSKRNSGSGWLVVAENVRQQEDLAAEIESWGQDAVVLPEAFRGSENVRPDPELKAEWIDALARLTARHPPRLCVVTERILEESLPDPAWLRNSIRSVEVGTTLDPLGWVEELVKAGYRTVGTVTERGEVARRGGIVDVFS
ncbi:MAG: hypothetical protein RLZZ112_406, partial [Verrucomicrobiota bacterium]